MTVASPDEARPDSVQAFADDLREIQRSVDIEALVECTGLLAETIENLLRGDDLYSWEVTCVYVNACAGDTAVWWNRWKTLTMQLGRRVWWKAEVVGPLPDPATAVSNQQFAELVAELKGKFKDASYEKLEKRAESNGHSLPHASLNSAIKARRLLSVERVQAFVAACGLPDTEIRRWRAARMRVDTGPPVSPNADPPSRPARATRHRSGRPAIRRRINTAVIAGMVVTLLVLVFQVIRLENASPVLLSLMPDAGAPSSSVEFATTFPNVGDWDVEIHLRPRNDDPYSDCVSRSTVTGEVNGQGFLQENGMSAYTPIRLRLSQAGSLRMAAAVTVPSAGAYCSRMVLELVRMQVSPVLPGWLQWLP